MAWQAILTGFDLDNVSVTVGYYDDADPTNSPTPQTFLYSKVFSGAYGSLAELRAAVISVGQAKRQAYQRASQVKAAGAIPIP